MSAVGVFALQFIWFLVVWSAVATVLVEPRLRNADSRIALSVWVAPHLFRVLGLGLLVPELSPGMPASFAVSTAAGDGIAAVLALAALLALHLRWRRARVLVWGLTGFGLLDLTVAGVHAARVGAAAHLEAQWYVAALGVPLMIVTHVMALHTLVTRR